MSNAIVTSESSAARAPLPDPILDADALAPPASAPLPPKSGPTLVAVKRAPAIGKPTDRELVERTRDGDATRVR